ncbi:MAG: hypothetical protein PWQ59_1344 [Thermoanaerobacterium sp.]|nr:hypothetical protein [Thermoanaerobacterium sp.]
MRDILQLMIPSINYYRIRLYLKQVNKIIQRNNHKTQLNVGLFFIYIDFIKILKKVEECSIMLLG